MAYLYLNFAEYLNESKAAKPWGKEELFSLSLSQQYENIRHTLKFAPPTLQSFISSLFTVDQKRYFISLPAFDRTMKQDGKGRQHIYNIIIRPEKDRISDTVLPRDHDLIVIGDISFGRVTEITVKGMELIDASVRKFGEEAVSCIAACAFQEKTLNNGIEVPDYGGVNLYDSVLTNDLVDRICKHLFPIPHPERAIRVLREWENYLAFRKYYLNIQSERCEEIASVRACAAYLITKESFRKDEERYSALLLDGNKEFAKGEQVILAQAVSSSDEFPLIRVDIEKNRKAVLSETEGRDGKGRPKYETHLNRYTRETMGLSKEAPHYDADGNLPKGFRFNQYSLGERYLFTHEDIEPDCSDIDRDCAKKIAAQSATVDAKYAGIITGEVGKYIAAKRGQLEGEYRKRYESYVSSLAEHLERDIAENRDKEVKKAYEAELARRTDSLKQKYPKAKDAETLSEEIAALRKEIKLRSFYEERNCRLAGNEKKSLSIAYEAEIDRLTREKKAELEVQYREAVRSEKEAFQKETEAKARAEKALRIENKTVRIYHIYFRPADSNDKATELQKSLEACGARYLVYDNRAEKAKIERQEKALSSIRGGYVRNPYLPAYLFAPETLAETPRAAIEEIDWCLESLNDRQKLAVQKALASESLFLLQGPPGTGKTQVIAEIAAQLCRRGKKVLISSETHKAIDNVFERLPRIPEIRPLRLIPSQNRKETNFSPERLVDNFYLNISGNLERQVRLYEHFDEMKSSFRETMDELRAEYEKLLRLRGENSKVRDSMNALIAEINRLNKQIEDVREQLIFTRTVSERYERTQKAIENCRFDTEDVEQKYIDLFREAVAALLRSFASFAEVAPESIGKLLSVDSEALEKETALLLSEDTLPKLEARRNEVRKLLAGLRDPDTDDAPAPDTPDYEQYKQYQNELREIVSEIKKAQTGSNFDLSDSIIAEAFPSLLAQRELLRKLPEELALFKIKLRSEIERAKREVELVLAPNVEEERVLEGKIDKLKLAVSGKNREYEELSQNTLVAEYDDANTRLKQHVTKFFNDFHITREYGDFEEAFGIIKEEWHKLGTEFLKTRRENEVKIPIYRDICKYLAQEDILEEDRQVYTRALFDNVNVFGITCTSRDKYTKAQLDELEKYGIASVDIRTQGIDVVIVDEVSKSSFLDLLIPILYGKTVILVGDHRQLPPMYDLQHLRREDFEGLDENIVTKQKNDAFTALYEECFFKTLYEAVPEDFKVMLNKQYRCHSHIMEVFNHFYGGSRDGLKVGKKQQDDEKEHNLTVKIGGRPVIEPRYHVYFVDCDGKESSAFEGSTSKINEQEAQVAMELLRALDRASNERKNGGKTEVNEERKVDERPSVGVICTYGDQAALIKKKCRGRQFQGFSGKQDERLIISTVDDFQGDERDIILLSMVRNPQDPRRAKADFITKFERINVALSRARKLLIVIGSRKYLSEAGIIDLPDMDGRGQGELNFPVFRKIIDTIDLRGRILSASDILGGELR